MKKFGFLALVLLSVFSCIKKPVEELVDIPPVNYMIKGILNNEDGVTPIPNRRLVLSVRGDYSLTGYGKDIGYTQIATTDNHGNYK